MSKPIVILSSLSLLQFSFVLLWSSVWGFIPSHACRTVHQGCHPWLTGIGSNSLWLWRLNRIWPPELTGSLRTLRNLWSSFLPLLSHLKPSLHKSGNKIYSELEGRKVRNYSVRIKVMLLYLFPISCIYYSTIKTPIMLNSWFPLCWCDTLSWFTWSWICPRLQLIQKASTINAMSHLKSKWVFKRSAYI